MTFNLDEALEILSRSPESLRSLLSGLSNGWIQHNEGPETWTPYDVLGHLVNAEQSNWMPRLNMILEHGERQSFEAFDRFAHFKTSEGQSIDDLLAAFAQIRAQNLNVLRSYALTEQDLNKTGTHPEFGQVKLSELLATWVVHDLSHIRQIVRTMAKQYESEVGPWKAYLSIFQT